MSRVPVLGDRRARGVAPTMDEPEETIVGNEKETISYKIASPPIMGCTELESVTSSMSTTRSNQLS